MSRIRSQGTGPERAVARALRRIRCAGWRRHSRVLGTRPDFVWRRERVALFVDGCFWHGCPRCYKAPKSRRAFWKTKLAHNRRRDDLQSRWLRTCGWVALRLWECQLRRGSDAAMAMLVVRRFVLGPRRWAGETG